MLILNKKMIYKFKEILFKKKENSNSNQNKTEKIWYKNQDAK